MQNYNTIIGVLELRLAGLPYSSCRAKFHIGNSTIQLIDERYKQIGLSIDDLRSANPQKVIDAFFPPENARKKKIPLPDYQKVLDRLAEKGSKANLFYLWTEYKKENLDGYQYTQFVEHFNRFMEENYGKRGVSMAVERVPGERVFIDWVGDQPELLLDPSNGELKKVHIFVTTVGVSSLIYSEAFLNERSANFIGGTVRALESYGAIPRYLVPDNTKTAVIRHTKDELLVNSAYKDLESFYGVVVLPPPALKPKGKPSVEKAVQQAETWIVEELKKRVYTSLDSINEEIRNLVDGLNNSKPRGWSCTRREMFERYDRPRMKDPVDGHFAPCDYVAFLRVPDNYHLLYKEHYYSVPYAYYGKPVVVKATAGEVKICDENNRLVCTHARVYSTFPKYVTKPEHMPSNHRFYAEVNSRNGDYYRRWASAIGPSMLAFVERMIASFDHEEQSYGSCNGVLHLCDGVPKAMADSAARKCVELNSCKYSYFKRSLSEVSGSRGNPDGQLPEHGNVRGEGYYE